jgi:hypothetical protein
VNPEVLILVGLPGCGKTTYVEELRREGWDDFDDFKSRALDNSSEFRRSSRFEALAASLQAGHRCVVADIDFCCANSREEACNVLISLSPSLTIRWCFFASDVGTCEKNVRRRDRAGSLDSDLAMLRKYSAVYRIPDGAEIRPVFCGNAPTWRPGLAP